MPDQSVIDSLIATYRDLNFRIRGLGAQADANTALVDALRALRDRELRASQAIKQILAGDAVTEDDELPLGDEAPLGGNTAASLLSQFGTAREATLAMIRELPDEEWNKTVTTPRGELTLAAYVQTLIDRDRQRLEEIDNLLKAHA